jgi:serine/threonine-protein kinase
LNSLELTGHPVTLVENVMWSPGVGKVHFALSREGALAYIPGGAALGEPNSLVWVDRKGERTPVTGERHAFLGVRVSPEGERLALTIKQEGDQDLWIYEFAQKTLSRLTFTPEDEVAFTWHPDGTRLFYSKWEPSSHNIFWIPADGSGEPERLFESEYPQHPISWSPDGRLLVFNEVNLDVGFDMGWDIGVITMEGDRKPRLLLEAPFREWYGSLSPNGRWLAYVSNETGRDEVYVRPFPHSGAKRRVSKDGGLDPVWSPNGGELFYRSDKKLMAVDVQTQPDLSVSSPRLLFEADFVSDFGGYDMTPDGQRFVIIQGEEQSPPEIRVILNWLELLERHVPEN